MCGSTLRKMKLNYFDFNHGTSDVNVIRLSYELS